jgi:hypothetical protein
VVRRRRNLRKPSAPTAHAATASTAGTCIEVIVDRVELARPTRTTPVLVTGPSLVGAAAAAAEAGAVVAADEAVAEGVADSAAVEGVGLFEPLSMPGPPIVVAGAVYVYVCDDSVLGLVGAVVGVVGVGDSVTMRAPETVMVTDGLPGPHAALTVYEPEADGEIVADPLKLICVFEIDAEPPTKADE